MTAVPSPIVGQTASKSFFMTKAATPSVEAGIGRSDSLFSRS
jgi:hypothetical protein